MTGVTNATGYPTTPGAYQRAFRGGEENTHGDAVVTKLNPSGTGLVYSTFLGGKEVDFGTGIAVDSAGGVYVGGVAGSWDFPTTPGAFQTSMEGTSRAWAAKLALTATLAVPRRSPRAAW